MFHKAGTPPITLRIGRPVRTLSAGNHHPLLCQMESAAGPAGLWVVKPAIVLSRSTDRGTFGVLAELAGAEVCAWAGLLAPQVGLTHFPQRIDDTALRAAMGSLDPAEYDEIVELYRANAGRIAYCGRYLGRAPNLVPSHFLRPKWRTTAVPDAVALLVADAYMRHDDRLRENSNAIWFKDRLVAIDHGLAFAGLTRRGTTGDDVAQRTTLHAPNFDHHVAFRAVRKLATDADWDLVTGRFEAVPGSSVSALADGWPANLDEDDQCGQAQLRSRMARFLTERGRHVRELVTVLRELVSHPRERTPKK
jgi:hypothetical protein